MAEEYSESAPLSSTFERPVQASFLPRLDGVPKTPVSPGAPLNSEVLACYRH